MSQCPSASTPATTMPLCCYKCKEELCTNDSEAISVVVLQHHLAEQHPITNTKQKKPMVHPNKAKLAKRELDFDSTAECGSCGLTGHGTGEGKMFRLLRKQKCPAYFSRCRICKRIGHFDPFCKEGKFQLESDSDRASSPQ